MRDKLVYKYVTKERVDVLQNGHIRFTQAAALNDPFESQPCIVKFKTRQFNDLLTKAKEKFGPDAEHVQSQLFRAVLVEYAAEKYQSILGHLFAMLCVSRVSDNLLMWSHYADSHTGFVIGLDANSTFFAPSDTNREGLKAVQYSRDRFAMPPGGLRGLSDDELALANDQFFFTKSTDWKYEQEMRMLAQPQKSDLTINTVGELPKCLYKFPRELVREVIVGLNTPLHVKESLATIVSETYSHARLLQAVMDSDRFALTFVPYAEWSRREKLLAPLRKRIQFKVEFVDKM